MFGVISNWPTIWLSDLSRVYVKKTGCLRDTGRFEKPRTFRAIKMRAGHHEHSHDTVEPRLYEIHLF